MYYILWLYCFIYLSVYFFLHQFYIHPFPNPPANNYKQQHQGTKIRGSGLTVHWLLAWTQFFLIEWVAHTWPHFYKENILTSSCVAVKGKIQTNTLYIEDVDEATVTMVLEQTGKAKLKGQNEVWLEWFVIWPLQ